MGGLSRTLLAVPISLAVVAVAQASPAGPLEQDFRGWQRLETAHFVFVFEPRDSRSIGELVSIAEDVYGEVTTFVGACPPRVWVIVAGRVDTANAVTFPFPAHLTLYLAPPSEPLIGLEASSYLRLLLAHELTHLVNFQYDRGMFAFFSSLFGPAVRSVNAAFLPTWFLEGIATRDETEFTDGGRGRNPFFEMEYRAFALSHRFFSLSRAAYSSFFPPADRSWIGGYLFFHYLLNRYGNDIYGRIYEEYARFPVLGPWKAIERATGKSAESLYNDMLNELENRYEGRQSIEAGRLAAPKGIGDYYLPIITTRGWLLYRTTPERSPAIVVYDPANKHEQVLLQTSLTDSVSLTASPDGSRVVFSTDETTLGESGEIVASDLFELDPGTHALRRVTTGAHVWQPRLTPDGKRLFAVSAVGSCSRLVEVDQATGSLRLLYSQTDAIVSTPCLSPDGLQVAFTVTAQGATSIRVLPLSSREVPLAPSEVLRDFNAEAAVAVVGPTRQGAYYPRFIDADQILFSSSEDGVLALYSTDAAGGRCSRVCEDPVGAWAGEMVGGQVLYATYRTDGYTLMMKQAQVRPSESPAPAPSPARREAPATMTPLSTSPYVDFPQFLAWAPLPIYYSTIASAEIVAAPGAAIWGLSNLGTSSYAAAVSFRTDALQPAVELSLQSTLGTVGLGYTLSEGYTNLSATDHEQELRQQLGLTVPLISSTLLSETSTLSLVTSVSDSLIAEGPQGFTFMDGLGVGTGASTLSFSQTIDATMGVGWQRSSIDSPFDLFALSQTLASMDVSLYPPVVSATGPGEVITGLAAISFPSPVSHEVIQLGVKTSYVGLTGSFYQITNPRGAFDPVIQSMPGRVLVSVDYLAPIALLDTPLVYSLGLIGIGCGFHVEAAADWASAFVPDQDIYTGVELVLNVSAGEEAFPVGIGLSFRFDPRFATPPDWATDLRPYIFLSTDSFAGTVLGATSLRRP